MEHGTGIDTDTLRGRLCPPLTAVHVVASTGSTNADMVADARGCAAHGTLLLALEQTAGRGRRSRSWSSPPGSGLYGSVLLRPAGIPSSRLGWVPLLGGLAVAELAADVAGVDGVALKWPNDVLADGGKLAGVLAEAVPAAEGLAVVLGIGLNVLPQPGDVPAGPGGLPATSLAEHGAAVTDLTRLAAELYSGVASRYDRWSHADGDVHGSGLLAEYRARCTTLGAEVRVELVGESVEGVARDVDADGRLVLELPGGRTREIAAGDVVHLRGRGKR